MRIQMCVGEESLASSKGFNFWLAWGFNIF